MSIGGTCTERQTDPPLPFIPSTAFPSSLEEQQKLFKERKNATKKIKWDDKTKGETSNESIASWKLGNRRARQTERWGERMNRQTRASSPGPFGGRGGLPRC